MVHVPFLPVYIILISLWVPYSFSRWHKKQSDFKRELLIQFFFIYFLLVLKYTFSPFYLNLIYPTRDMNLMPLIETIAMLKGARLADALYNLVGNFLMLTPFGFLIAAIYPGIRNSRNVFLYSLGLSFTIEVLQYVSTTRIFDIDDIVLNILGSFIGYGCFHIAHRLFPVKPPEGTVPQKPSLRMIVAGLITLVLTFSSVFAYTYEKQTLSLKDIQNGYTANEKTRLLTVTTEHHRYNLVKKGDFLTLELYGILPFNHFVSVAASDPIQLGKEPTALGDLNYQITYRQLDKTGTITVRQKAPYALFGYVPDAVAGGEVSYNSVPCDLLFEQQYFLSVFEAEMPFEKKNQHVSVKIKDTNGKKWNPKFNEK